jgi:hypothetical protein
MFDEFVIVLVRCEL